MLEIVKLALRRSDETFDDELESLIAAALDELEGLGVYHPDTHCTTSGTTETYDAQIQQAVIAYCKWKFGENENAERWEHIFSDMVTKLQCRAGYGLPEADDGQI